MPADTKTILQLCKMNDGALMGFVCGLIVSDPSDELRAEGSIILKLFVNTQDNHLDLVELLLTRQ